MKKINSNSYGGKIIGIGLIPLLFIPGILWIVNCFLKLNILRTIMYISAGIGALIELSFSILLIIEFAQDRKIQSYYDANPNSSKSPQEIIDGKS